MRHGAFALPLLLLPAVPLADGGAPAPRAERYGLRLDASHPETSRFLAHFGGRRGRGHLEATLMRGERYRAMILAALRRHGLPEDLVWLPVVESDYRPYAVSRSGAAGLWQLMPQTARMLGLKVTRERDERFDPVKSTEAALRHLRALRDKFGGDWDLVLTAYNCGDARLRSVLAGRGRLVRESREYFPKFSAVALIAREPQRYGLDPRGPRWAARGAAAGPPARRLSGARQAGVTGRLASTEPLPSGLRRGQ